MTNCEVREEGRDHFNPITSANYTNSEISVLRGWIS